MRETKVVIDRYCDVCYQESDGDDDNYTIATDCYTVGVVAGDKTRPTPKVLDLCEAHAKPIAELSELLSHIGQLPMKAEPAPTRPVVNRSPSYLRQVLCPVCRRQTARTTLAVHIWKWHRTDKRPPIPTVCPECGKELRRGTGMGTHRRMAHDYDAVADALSGVKGYKVTGKERDL